MAGSRRIKVGSARDHLLGFEAVSGRAEQFKSCPGDKNVTGYDLPKVICGFLTLPAVMKIDVKVLLMPEKVYTLSFGLDAGTGEA